MVGNVREDLNNLDEAISPLLESPRVEGTASMQGGGVLAEVAPLSNPGQPGPYSEIFVEVR